MHTKTMRNHDFQLQEFEFELNYLTLQRLFHMQGNKLQAQNCYSYLSCKLDSVPLKISYELPR